MPTGPGWLDEAVLADRQPDPGLHGGGSLFTLAPCGLGPTRPQGPGPLSVSHGSAPRHLTPPGRVQLSAAGTQRGRGLPGHCDLLLPGHQHCIPGPKVGTVRGQMTPGPWECWKTWKSGLKPHPPPVRGQQDPRYTSSRPQAGGQSPALL